MRLAAVVLAAGDGRRFGSTEPKQFLLLDDRTVLEHAVGAFLAVDRVDEVWVATAAAHVDRVRTICGSTVTGVVAGGDTRQESTRLAVAALDESVTHVLVHDAARPLVTTRTIEDCVDALDGADVVATVVPVDDTVVVVSEHGIEDVPDRANLRAHQTPQGFRRSVLTAAHAADQTAVTDDVSLVMHALPHSTLALVDGDRRALKLTRPDDLVMLRALLAGGPARP